MARLLRLRPEGRGGRYSPARGAVESALRLAYRGDWPGRLWGRVPGANRVRLNRFAIPAPGLSRPLRVGFASDLHFGPTTAPGALQSARDLLAGASLDLLALGGDYVFLDADPARAEALRRWVASIPAALKVAVMGNHDLWTRHELLEDALRAAGAEVLVNRAIQLPGGAAVVGLDEPWTGAPAPDTAFAGAAGAPFVLALVHSPDGWPHVRGRGAQLMLCGHTHGGQIALPGGRPIVMPAQHGDRFPHGLRRDGDLQIYVSRGVGGVEVPVRAWAPPDVAVFEIGSG